MTDNDWRNAMIEEALVAYWGSKRAAKKYGSVVDMRAVQGGYKPREKPEPLSAWKAHDIERMRSVVGAALRATLSLREGGVR